MEQDPLVSMFLKLPSPFASTGSTSVYLAFLINKNKLISNNNKPKLLKTAVPTPKHIDISCGLLHFVVNGNGRLVKKDLCSG